MSSSVQVGGSARYIGKPVEALPIDPEATLQVKIAMAWVALGVSGGVPVQELVSVAGLSPTQLGDPDATLRIDDSLALLDRVERALPDRALGLDLLDMTPPSAWGLIDLASQNAATIGEGADIYLRYVRLTSSHFQGWLERSDDLAVYRCRHVASVEVRRHPVDVALGHTLRLLQRSGATPGDLVEVHFGHAPVGPVERYEAFFGCPLHFESFGHAVVCNKSLLDRPMRHADPVLSRSLAARLDTELSSSEDGLAQLRREVAAHARPAQYASANIAQRMGKSLRSLQREAAAAGTTLRQLIDDVRIARARELLLDSALSIDEVGFLVDYSERAAFSRAFKRATGETPAAYRRRGGN